MRKLPYMHLPMRGKSFSPWMGSRYLYLRAENQYFAVNRQALSFLPQDGATFETLRPQVPGSVWIGTQNPIALRTVQIGDPDVPTIRERRAAIEQLAEAAFPPHTTLSILEGLFLRTTKRYLALVHDGDTAIAQVVGTNITPTVTDFPGALVQRSGSVYRDMVDSRA